MLTHFNGLSDDEQLAIKTAVWLAAKGGAKAGKGLRGAEREAAVSQAIRAALDEHLVPAYLKARSERDQRRLEPSEN